MIKLVPMQDTEFEPFMQISMHDQAQGQVQTGQWKADEADANIQKLRAQFLPQGLNTPNHYFFALTTEDLAQNVGSLWFTVVEQDGKRTFFVMDIQVYPEYRRRGYGSQAFRQMEAKALEMGITRISLHVFKQNHAARAMYEQLGYTGPHEAMVKELSKA